MKETKRKPGAPFFPIERRPKRADIEREERIGRIDLRTLSDVELELVEIYRAMTPQMRGALLVVAKGALHGFGERKRRDD